MNKNAGPGPINEICMDLARLTGPVRSVSFELITELILLNLSSFGGDAAELTRMFKIYKTAIEALETGMKSRFRTAGIEIDPTLEECRKNTLRIVREAEKRLIEIKTQADNKTASTDNFIALSSEMRIMVIPAISDFLAALQTVRETYSDKDTQSGKDVVRSAVSKIDTIALSIRLISLNASVEAAHAGEAGRGFAVIAQEIQNLSDEAKQAIDYVRARIA